MKIEKILVLVHILLKWAQKIWGFFLIYSENKVFCYVWFALLLYK